MDLYDKIKKLSSVALKLSFADISDRMFFSLCAVCADVEARTFEELKARVSDARQQHNNGKEFALFVTAILNATLNGYTFRNRATKRKILDTKIKLPVDKNGEIDYNKIKNAMGDILDIAENRLNDLKEILNGKLQ